MKIGKKLKDKKKFLDQNFKNVILNFFQKRKHINTINCQENYSMLMGI